MIWRDKKLVPHNGSKMKVTLHYQANRSAGAAGTGGNKMETRTCAMVILTTHPSHHHDCRDKFIQTSKRDDMRILLGPP